MTSNPSDKKTHNPTGDKSYVASMGTLPVTAPPESLPQHLLRAVKTHVASEEHALKE